MAEHFNHRRWFWGVENSRSSNKGICARFARHSNGINGDSAIDLQPYWTITYRLAS
jgi:hypothetical protein